MNIINAIAIEKSFGNLKVLNGISFDVKKGRCVSILGPSGCGKSTLLRILAGLMKHDNGTVEIKSKNIGIMFQEPRLLHWRNVKQNISIGLELKGMQIDEEKINCLLDIIGLKDYGEFYPNQISGGMKQRVALARTLATEPDVLLMDEPLSALDYNTRKDLQNRIMSIQKEKKLTTLFVTHSIEEAKMMGDETIVLSQKPTVIQKILKNHEI